MENSFSLAGLVIPRRPIRSAANKNPRISSANAWPESSKEKNLANNSNVRIKVDERQLDQFS
jgi:hypothetical protein